MKKAEQKLSQRQNRCVCASAFKYVKERIKVNHLEFRIFENCHKE